MTPANEVNSAFSPARSGAAPPAFNLGALGDPRALAAFRRALLRWFAGHQRDLPWRRTGDPYRIWLSEVLLQQTRVETVRAYYERFVTAFPTVAALAAAKPDDVLRLWAGLGYYSRARNMHAAARVIVEIHGGRVPDSAESLRRLPGIGRYTAAAVASIAFGERVAALDGNIKRVLARLLAITSPIDTPETTAQLWEYAAVLLAPRRPGDFNQALMELGATVCLPRAPRCSTCPVRRWCAAATRGLTRTLPRRQPKRAVGQALAAAAAIWRRGRLLVVQRPPHGLLGGLWELPSVALPMGDVAPGTAEFSAALQRDLGILVAVGPEQGEITHQFTHRVQRTRVHTARYVSGRVVLARHVAARWIDPRAVNELAWSTMDRKILATLEAQA